MPGDVPGAPSAAATSPRDRTSLWGLWLIAKEAAAWRPSSPSRFNPDPKRVYEALTIGRWLDWTDSDGMNHQAKFSLVAGARPYFARTKAGRLHAEPSA